MQWLTANDALLRRAAKVIGAALLAGLVAAEVLPVASLSRLCGSFSNIPVQLPPAPPLEFNLPVP